jgi:hypothetical protein
LEEFKMRTLFDGRDINVSGGFKPAALLRWRGIRGGPV